MAEEKCFLIKHRSEITKRTRDPISLSDALLDGGCITMEMYENIKSQKHKIKQMREVYIHLTSRKHFKCTYDWLKEDEPDLMEELEEKDAEAEAPLKNKSRAMMNRTVDEPDNNHTGFSDLKMISTFAKLEKWISEPEIRKKLISGLEGKLGQQGMDALKKELNDKEPKKILCFRAKDIDDIKKNKELETFLNGKKAEIPSLTLKMFFKKSTSASPGNKAGHNRKPKAPGQPLKHANEPITNNDGPDMKENEDTNVPDNCKPSKLLQKKRPASASDHISNKVLCVLQEEAGLITQNTDTATPAPETQSMVQDSDSIGGGFRTSTSKAVKHQAGEPAVGATARGGKEENMLNKKDERNKPLRAWALRLSNGSETELKKISDHISVINLAEHGEYPCFTAENITVFENPKTSETQILFITDQKISSTTKTTLHYHMFVCGVKSAVLLGPGEHDEQEIQYEESFIRINKCKRFILEAFAPALTVFREIQEEELHSAIGRRFRSTHTNTLSGENTCK